MEQIVQQNPVQRQHNRVQYNHSLSYSGNYPEIQGNRMSIRIEETGPDTFLVTKAVCSKADSFCKKTARALTDLRSNIHKSCLAHSQKYRAFCKKLDTHTVTIFVHGQESSDIAYEFHFTTKIENPHYVISEFFRNDTYS